MKASRQFFASLHPSRSVPHFVKQCRTILDRMGNGAAYASPPIPYATVTAHVDALDKAEQSVGQNGAADRDAKLLVCRGDMRLYKAFVQGLADADRDNARTLIEGAGMFASMRAPRAKQNLAARIGVVPGRVHLDTKAAKRRASYFWQMRIGQAPWSDFSQTVVSKATVDGLTPATIVEFRVRTLTADGYSDWSSPVSIVVR